MAVFRPFKSITPKSEFVGEVAALPYDVMSSDEARRAVIGRPYSFLHVDKAEIDLPKETDLYSEEVYLKARENLDNLVKNGICFEESEPVFYIYRQAVESRVQTGLVGCVSIDDYINNVIKKHEMTKPDKEQDRINHVTYCDANTGPIYLTYRPDESISETIKEWQATHKHYCRFNSDDGVESTIWRIDDRTVIKRIAELFARVKNLYIADGHHRAASAVKVGLKKREEHPDYSGNEEFNYFLAVLFSCDELKIMDYNRVINYDGNLSVDELCKCISEKFTVEKIGKNPFKPTEPHTFGWLAGGEWYKLKAKDGTFPTDPVSSLDVSIIHNNLIAPILGITDPRTDKRIDFVGGIRGLRELEMRTKTDMNMAFAMYPTTLDELMSIADAGEIMPPKSTWFEPKLLSGLFIHKLS